MGLKKITMNLSERDLENAQHVETSFNSRSKASAVSSSLAIASEIADLIASGAEILVKGKNGEMQKLIIPGLKSRA